MRANTAIDTDVPLADYRPLTVCWSFLGWSAIGRLQTLVAVRFRQAFVVQRQTPEAIAQPKLRSTTERRGSGTKPFLQSTT